MNRGGFAVVSGLLVLTCLTACSATVAGTATWPGATLERVLLTEQDFPAGVHYDRLTDDSTQPDGAGGPPPMISQPPGCANALTNVIAKSAERGPGSALSYSVSFDGARVVMTALSWQLDLEGLAATAGRCERFEAFFDSQSDGIPMTTTRLRTERPDALVYEQTMDLSGAKSSVFFAFENVGRMAVFGIAFSTPVPAIAVKGSLPQTFLDISGKQAERLPVG